MKTKTVKFSYTKSIVLDDLLISRIDYLKSVIDGDVPSMKRSDRWQGIVSIRLLNGAINYINLLRDFLCEDFDNMPAKFLMSRYRNLYNCAVSHCAEVNFCIVDQVLGRSVVAMVNKLSDN